MDCEQVQELLEVYVLDALDRDEHDAVTAHLAQCANCQRLLAEYQTILVSLPVGLAVAAPAYPPAALKDRILQAIDSPSVDQSAPVAISSANGSAVNVSATSGPGRASARRNRRRILLPLAAAILVLALLALGTGLSVALAREQALRAALANL